MASVGTQRWEWEMIQSTEAMSTGMNDNEARRWQQGHSRETKEDEGNAQLTKSLGDGQDNAVHDKEELDKGKEGEKEVEDERGVTLSVGIVCLMKQLHGIVKSFTDHVPNPQSMTG